MSRRRVAIGAAIALLGGFAIEKLTEVFELSAGVAMLAFLCLIAAVMVGVVGRETRSAVGSAPKAR